MVRTSAARAFCLLLALVLLVPAGAQDKGKNLILVPTEGPLKGQKIYNNSHALLIGINKYPGLPLDRQLDYAIADVDAVKKILIESYGFDEQRVTVLKDDQATKAAILKTLNALTDNTTIDKQDRLIIYFSGHGQTVTLPTGGEIGFVIPHDAQVDLNNVTNARPYNETCIKMEEIWGILRLSPAKHVLFMADSCYSGLAVKNRSIAISPAALAALTKEPALHGMSAGKRSQVSVELPDKGHGAFTFALLQALRVRAGQPGVPFTVNDLFSDVQATVANVTEGKQTPQFGNVDTEGVFVFIPAGAKATVEVAPAAPGKPAANVPKAQVESVETVAKLKIETSPPGAKVFIDDQEVPGKVTPALIEIDLGRSRSKEIEIAVELDGHKAAIRKATLVRGLNPGLTVKLDKTAAPAPVPQKPPTAAPTIKPAANPPRPAPAGAVNLVRNWKEGASVRAKSSIDIKSGLIQGKMEETFRLSVASVSGEGTATLRQVSEGGTLTSQLGTEASPPGPPQSEMIDRLGRLMTSNGGANEMFDEDTQRLIGISTDALLPGRPVAPGETWKTTVDNPVEEDAKMTFTGRFVGVEEFKGVAAWKIHQTASVEVGLDDGSKFGVGLTFWVNPATGLVIRVQGTLKNVPTNVGPMLWTISMQALEIN